MPMKITLGGVPTGVPIPDARGVGDAEQQRDLECLAAAARLILLEDREGDGRSIKVVAVLLIHMLQKAVASMKPRTKRLPPAPPTRRTIPTASRL